MTTQQPRADQRPVWIAIFLLAAAVLGIVAGFLAHAGGVHAPAAVLAGGGAFSTALLLLLALAHHAAGSRWRRSYNRCRTAATKAPTASGATSVK